MPRRNEPKEDTFVASEQVFRDYSGQEVWWPSADESQAGYRREAISDMSPQHAISALRKLERWWWWMGLNNQLTGEWKEYSRRDVIASPLYQALLKQAVGSEAWRYMHVQVSDPADPMATVVFERDDLLALAIDIVATIRESPVSLVTTPSDQVKTVHRVIIERLNQMRENQS